MKQLKALLEANKQGEPQGIYSICSAHPVVLEAAIEQAKQDQTPILIEATANQVNQFGGYTGMKPADFIKFITDIADQVDYPVSKIITGGDHLGPVCWTHETAEEAMSKAKVLVAEYVKAGFKKLHLDTSMSCSGDPTPLPDAIVAYRAAELCKVAEETALSSFGTSDLLFIIGTEVPPPGGASEEIDTLTPTPVCRVETTLKLHEQEFAKLNLQNTWERVVGLVVQPGVEFDHTHIFDFDQTAVTELTSFIKGYPNIVYEAHSSDYQLEDAYKHLVNHHFAILKVGPQLTFAMREALFALSYIEDQLIPIESRSYLRDVCEREMLEQPESWQKFYPKTPSQGLFFRRYSYSDRIRYYWHSPSIQKAVCVLLDNLSAQDIPLPLISQFLPEQYKEIRVRKLEPSPMALIKSKIKQVLSCYAIACWKQ
ncbi:D-tagatose-bisphosphate aldolase, class II, non-catalytic subunit [Thalassotalea maritima]|uniref:D-tagatose-bisphosphate aldolase, class II, non-catalytic subunit n=1 Tax=Thalassotalea maritima TaxID=3242416 RepID=UPI003528D706